MCISDNRFRSITFRKSEFIYIIHYISSTRIFILISIHDQIIVFVRWLVKKKRSEFACTLRICICNKKGSGRGAYRVRKYNVTILETGQCFRVFHACVAQRSDAFEPIVANKKIFRWENKQIDRCVFSSAPTLSLFETRNNNLKTIVYNLDDLSNPLETGKTYRHLQQQQQPSLY